MKKLIVLMLFPLLNFAQLHRFIYHLYLKKDSTVNKVDSVKMVLDVGKL